MITRVHIDILKKESIEKIREDIENLKEVGMFNFDNKGLCPFMYAIKSENIEYMKLIHPYYYEHKTKYDKNILHLASETKNDYIIEYISMLIKKNEIRHNKIMLLEVDKNSRSPLLNLLKYQKGKISLELINDLIEYVETYKEHLNEEYKKIIKQYSYKISYYDRDGDNVLKRLVKLTDKDLGLKIFNKLINYFYEIDLNKKDIIKNKTNNKFEGFIETIVKENNIVFFEYIKKNINNKKSLISNINLNVKNRKEETLLHLAAKNENYEMIKFFLENGVDFNLLDKKGKKYDDYLFDIDKKNQLLKYQNWLNDNLKINNLNIKELKNLKDRKELLSKTGIVLEDVDEILKGGIPF